MHIFLDRRINYGHVTWSAYGHSRICFRSCSWNSY